MMSPKQNKEMPLPLNTESESEELEGHDKNSSKRDSKFKSQRLKLFFYTLANSASYIHLLMHLMMVLFIVDLVELLPLSYAWIMAVSNGGFCATVLDFLQSSDFVNGLTLWLYLHKYYVIISLYLILAIVEWLCSYNLGVSFLFKKSKYIIIPTACFIIFETAFAPWLWFSSLVHVVKALPDYFLYNYTQLLFVSVSSLVFLLIFLGIKNSSVFKIFIWKTLFFLNILAITFFFAIYLSQVTPSSLKLCLYTLLASSFISFSFISIFQNLYQEEMKIRDEELGRERDYMRIHKQIRMIALENEHIDRLTGSAMAIYGDWGIGKTHLLEYLEYRLSNKISDEKDKNNLYLGRFNICKINLWDSKTSEKALVDITNQLYTKISGDSLLAIHRFPNTVVSLVMDFVSWFIPNIESLKSLIGIVSNSNNGQVDDKIRVIDQALGDSRAVLLIDDLERANYEIIRDFLPIIEKLKKIKKLTIVCAISVEELKSKFMTVLVGDDTVDGYLTKIFDHSFTLPEFSQSLARVKLLKDICIKYKDCKLLWKFIKMSNLAFDTPRQMERLVSCWANLERQYFYLIKVGEHVSMKTSAAFDEIKMIFIIEGLKIASPKVIEHLVDEISQNTDDTSLMKEPKNVSISKGDDMLNKFAKSALQFFDSYNSKGAEISLKIIPQDFLPLYKGDYKQVLGISYIEVVNLLEKLEEKRHPFSQSSSKSRKRKKKIRIFSWIKRLWAPSYTQMKSLRKAQQNCFFCTNLNNYFNRELDHSCTAKELNSLIYYALFKLLKLELEKDREEALFEYTKEFLIQGLTGFKCPVHVKDFSHIIDTDLLELCAVCLYVNQEEFIEIVELILKVLNYKTISKFIASVIYQKENDNRKKQHPVKNERLKDYLLDDKLNPFAENGLLTLFIPAFAKCHYEFLLRVQPQRGIHSEFGFLTIFSNIRVSQREQYKSIILLFKKELSSHVESGLFTQFQLLCNFLMYFSGWIVKPSAA